MDLSIACLNPYNLIIFIIDYSKNFTTRLLLTLRHMAMFVVKSFVIPINGQGYGSICSGHPQCPYSETYRPVPGQFEQG